MEELIKIPHPFQACKDQEPIFISYISVREAWQWKKLHQRTCEATLLCTVNLIVEICTLVSPPSHAFADYET